LSLTVLFDLDDTLLGNDMQTFSSAYFQLLSDHLSPYIPPQIMIKELLSATRKMIAKRMPALTLEQTFSDAFYPALGFQQADLAEVLVDFYKRVFPRLGNLTQPRPDAVRLVKWAIDQGWTVVVATNPLFPLRAIEHRLQWAGLPVSSTPFSLVTSIEGMHFAKPSEAYYAEILGQLGFPEQPAVMIGNSLSDDILPAARLGLPSFWLGGDSELPQGLPPHSRKGRMEDIADWLEDMSAHASPLAFQGYPAILGILGATPAALESITKGVPNDAWTVRPEAQEWSLVEILAHLRDVDLEVNLPRMNQLLNQDQPFFAGVDADAWASERNYRQTNIHTIMGEVMSARMSLLELIQPDSEQIWNRPARHAIFGPTTLGELASFIAHHDVLHIHQVKKSLRAIGI
jgi:FMN phosphatase YigB (HAD superfamily)